MNTCTVEKAAYELCYEAANRPTWIGVPLAGLATLANNLTGGASGRRVERNDKEA